MSILVLTFGAAFGAAAVFIAWTTLRAFQLFREAQVVACPQGGALAAANLNAVRAAETSLTGKPSLQLRSFSRSPEQSDCAQDCVPQIEAAPCECSPRSILARSYRGARCAECNVDFGDAGQGQSKPVLMSPDHKTRIEWDDVPPLELSTLLSTYSMICWNCHMEKSLRILRTTRVTTDSSRRGREQLVAS